MDRGTLMKLVSLALGPALIGGLVLLAAWWRQRQGAFVERDASIRPVARGGEPFWVFPALIAALVPLFIVWATEARMFPPVGASQWIPLVVLAAALVELLVQQLRLPRVVVHGARLLVLGASGYVCSRTFLAARDAGTGEIVLTVSVFTLLAYAMVWAADSVQSRTRGFVGPAMLVATVGASTQFVGLALSNLLLAMALTAMASLLGAAMVIGIIRRRFSLALGGAFVPVAMLAAVMLVVFLSTGARDDESSGRRWVYVGAVALSVLLPTLSLLPQFREWRGIRRAILLLVLAGLPLVPAMAVLGMDQMRQPEQEEAEEEYDPNAYSRAGVIWPAL